MKNKHAIILFAGQVANAAKNSGLSYKEVEISFRACLFMMEEIEKEPDGNEDALIEATLKFIEAQS